MRRGTDVRVAVIGAGPSGITAAKHLLQVGITNIKVFDKHDQVGGNWIYSPDPDTHSSVYETSHIISSKKFSQYHDFPMPEDYPDYPGHQLLLKYFQDYADHFGVIDYVHFNTEIVRAEVDEDHVWTLILGDGSTEQFDYLIAANGHHWKPRWPEFDTEFSGEYMHSHFYRTHLPFKDKRVLIIGAGNSACDITVDIARHASFVGLSWRRGYYVVPKFMFGRTPDAINAKSRWLPNFLRKRLFKLALRLAVGKMEDYGLPKPDHSPTESHPILNSQLLYHLRHGDIHPRKEVSGFDDRTVLFKDGRKEEYDTVIAATGYHIKFPFFDDPKLDFPENEVPLYLKMFHPDFPSLAIIGLVQPQGCIWPLSDTQAQLFANYIVGNYDWPHDVRLRIAKEVDQTKRLYLDSPRHSTEVDYHDFLHDLRKQLPRNPPAFEMTPAN